MAPIPPLIAPTLIAIGGLSGSGKSTLARTLAPQVGGVVLRSDVIRKELLGVAETERLGPSGYGAAITTQVYATLFERGAALLADAQTVILDAVFSKAAERAAAATVAHTAGVPFCGLWLEAPLDIALARIESRTGDASDATPRVRIMQEERLERPIDWAQVDARTIMGQDLMGDVLTRLIAAGIHPTNR